MSILAPNHYKLQNADGSQTVEYWPDTAKLILQSGSGSQTFTGAQITVQPVLIGQLVSVVAQTTPQYQTVVSVLLPTISLQNGKQTASFSTQGVITNDYDPNSQAYGPVFDIYTQWVPLSGQADLV